VKGISAIFMKKSKIIGHIFALISIITWGTTFISTKVLLEYLSPLEILFTRFLIGLVALIIIKPKKMILKDKKKELLFLGAGFFGITFYYLTENIALSLTSANNVGIISTMAPFFTAIAVTLYFKTDKPKLNFYTGFIVAIIGVMLITYTGSSNIEINPMGDILALVSTLGWAFYSIFIRRISDSGYDTILATRRILFYGFVCMLPMLLFMDSSFDIQTYLNPMILFNILFLGIGASALCFITWNSAIKEIGPIKCSIYIYLIPVVTIITSAIILNEALTFRTVIGVALALLGSWISQINK